jgi:2-amino-4-hydroxy-6-hydroxymethyldihydropteridine diphosphokinase
LLIVENFHFNLRVQALAIIWHIVPLILFEQGMAEVYLSIGSNEGDRLAAFKSAYKKVGEEVGKIAEVSSIYETDPWGFESTSRFLNQVWKIETNLEPLLLIEKLILIEESMGRKRGGGGYQSRIIDLDILFYESRVMDSANLKLPHPRISERRFVLVPLAEILPGFIHPMLGKSISALLDECKDTNNVSVIMTRDQVKSIFDRT